MTGLLARNVTLYYGVVNLSTGASRKSVINDINGTLGNVSIKDPIHKLQVRHSINTKKTTAKTQLYNLICMQVESTNFTLEVLMCPAGYVIHHNKNTNQNLLVCECNHNEPNILLCKDDQETVIMKVCILRELCIALSHSFKNILCTYA